MSVCELLGKHWMCIWGFGPMEHHPKLVLFSNNPEGNGERNIRATQLSLQSPVL